MLWLLLGAVLAVFILLSQAITPHRATSIVVSEGGTRAARLFDIFDLHAGTMAPVAVASLATLAGLFVALDTRAGDRRAVLAGLRPGAALAARLTVLAAATGLATAVSLAVAAFVFHPRQWVWYAVGNALIAFSYALLGVLIAPVFGRVAVSSSPSWSRSWTSASARARCCAANQPIGRSTCPVTARTAC